MGQRRQVQVRGVRVADEHEVGVGQVFWAEAGSLRSPDEAEGPEARPKHGIERDPEL